MFWRGKKVFVTGHTGFKGSWLSLWLQSLGAQVTGYALPPPTSPSLFETANVAPGMRSIIDDVADLPRLHESVAGFEPEVVFHLAAQPLVRESYNDPVLTYRTNVMGTVHVLESIRKTPSVRAAVIVTTDKCYQNLETAQAFRESDVLGGDDPYSNSKACAELVLEAYRKSFFSRHGKTSSACVASARAGNVIGGGDWACDRLIPDAIRAFSSNQVLKIRNPDSVRPWQHVLEPLRGYLLLAQRLHEHGGEYASAWNFGPRPADAVPVRWIIEKIADDWGAAAQWEIDRGDHPHEAKLLQLDWSKAAQHLDWRPFLTLNEALALTVDWYRAFSRSENMQERCLHQISGYCAKADDLSLAPGS